MSEPTTHVDPEAAEQAARRRFAHAKTHIPAAADTVVTPAAARRSKAERRIRLPKVPLPKLRPPKVPIPKPGTLTSVVVGLQAGRSLVEREFGPPPIPPPVRIEGYDPAGVGQALAREIRRQQNAGWVDSHTWLGTATNVVNQAVGDVLVAGTSLLSIGVNASHGVDRIREAEDTWDLAIGTAQILTDAGATAGAAVDVVTLGATAGPRAAAGAQKVAAGARRVADWARTPVRIVP